MGIFGKMVKFVGRVPPWIAGAVVAVACGVAMSFCYWPANLHFIAWIAMVPLLLTMFRMSAKGTFLAAFLFGIVFYRITLDWLLVLSGPYGVYIIIGLSFVLACAFWASRLAMHYIGPSAMLWSLPILYVGQEVCRAQGLELYRMPYAVFGVTQSHNLWVAQLASLGGVYFVSGVVIAVNAALAWLIYRRTLRAAIVGCGILAAFAGLAFIAQPKDYSQLPKIPVACVHVETESYNKLMDYCRQAAELPIRPKFVVMPEHTSTEIPARDEKMFILNGDKLPSIATDSGAYFIVGVHTMPPNKHAKCFYDNVAIVIDPFGKMICKQVKFVPVPFFDDGNPGSKYEVFSTPYGKGAAYVCIDGEYPDHPRRFVNLGAEVLFGPVYNASIWPHSQRWQQSDLVIFRCIEQRRCMARSANAGISHITDATGRNLAVRSAIEGPGVIGASIYFNNERTIYNRFGFLIEYAFGWGFIAAAIGFLLLEIALVIRSGILFVTGRSGRCEKSAS